MSKSKHPPSKSDSTETSAAEPEQKSPPRPEKKDSTFPIVGIGASAGGLAAFEAFFAEMPASTESGMALVVVQHLSPNHKSILSELIERYTQMQVFEVIDGIEVKPNCAYIIPPNRDMSLMDGKLYLFEPSAPRGIRMSIDFFFRSLAQDLREQAICIILSGTGSDGTQGVRAIKDAGGMAMVQLPESADYDGMPRSAIATGLVDFILPPVQMPEQLIAYVKRAFGKQSVPATPVPPKSTDALHKILILIRGQTGHDFSLYKQNSVIRRIERRMALHQIERLDAYVQYLRKNTGEVEALFRDLLIGVTSFFRDPEAFAFLEKNVIPTLFSKKSPGSPIRVWVPGCSTGEEAYSLAILLHEHMTVLKQNYRIQIFATDIDSHAIQTARTGLFSSSIAADISPERLARYFEHEPTAGTYRIQKSVRDLLTISDHDIIQAPPFSRLDLISCRNLLIYMGAELQRKLIPLFHYALNPEGLLFLGSSESVGEFTNLFTAVNRKWKLYQRQEHVLHIPSLPVSKFVPTRPPQIPVLSPVIETSRTSKLTVRELTEQTLLREYAPVSVLVNAQGDILYIHGRTGRFLEPAEGAAVPNILTMAREGLNHVLTTGLQKAASDAAPVTFSNLQVRSNGHFTSVNLTVRPVNTKAGNSPPNLYLVVLENPVNLAQIHEAKKDKTANPDTMSQDDGYLPGSIVTPTADTPTADTLTADMHQVLALEDELRRKEEYLQTTLEEMETSNEELRSINEELQSVNEELQSTNEELETAKEELQSVNEELATVNSELQQKVSDLSKANNDFNNLLAGTGVGTVFVDHNLRIQRFTPSVTNLIHLIKSDIGRPVFHIADNLVNYHQLMTDVQTVLDTLIPQEIEVQTRTGAWYLLSIRPYRTLENVIEGAVITFVDITRIKRAETLQRLATVVHDAYDAITVQDFTGQLLAWNPAAQRMYGWSEEEALGMNVSALLPEKHHAEADQLIRQLADLEVIPPYRTQRLTKDGTVIDVWLTATALLNETGEVYAIATTERATDQPARQKSDKSAN